MAERAQTIASLKRRYPKEWLLLTDVVTDELTRPVKGKLVVHSKTAMRSTTTWPAVEPRARASRIRGRSPKI